MTTQNASLAQTINELPITQHGNDLVVSAKLLHKKLQIQTRYFDWIKRRIEEYGFEEGFDFYSNLSKNSKGVGRPNLDHFLFLDTAKEFSMLEKNKTGRYFRRYFIEIEKRYRDWIGFILPRLEMDYDLFVQREGYHYVQLLKACGCSLRSGSRSARMRKNRQEFWRNGKGEVCVSETYGKAIITNAIARRLNSETKERRLEYESNQSLLTSNQGGAQ